MIEYILTTKAYIITSDTELEAITGQQTFTNLAELAEATGNAVTNEENDIIEIYKNHKS